MLISRKSNLLYDRIRILWIYTNFNTPIVIIIAIRALFLHQANGKNQKSTLKIQARLAIKRERSIHHIDFANIH